MYIYTCIRVCMYIYIYIYTHIHITKARRAPGSCRLSAGGAGTRPGACSLRKCIHIYIYIYICLLIDGHGVAEAHVPAGRPD